MIRVTVEVFPMGDESQRRTIATADIVNVGGGVETSLYLAVFKDDVGRTVGTFACRHAFADGAWALIRRCIEAAGGIIR